MAFRLNASVNISVRASDGSAQMRCGELSRVDSASQELMGNLNLWRTEW